MPVCPHCGRESRATDRYCLHCGQRMDVEPGSDPEMVSAYVAPDRNGGTWTASQPGMAAGNRASAPIVAVRPQIVARLVLEARAGDQDGPREYLLDGRDITIGRAPTCDVVLANDQLSSRRHTLLHLENDHYTIADLGSSNGTYVNGTEIHAVVPLSDGDRITVGEHDLVYTLVVARNTDGFPVPVPPPWPPAGRTAADRAPLSGPIQTAPPPGAAEPTSAVVELASAITPAAAAEMPPAPTATPAPPPAPPVDASLAQQLRQQLLETSAGLVRRVDDMEQETARMRAAMAELEQLVSATLASLGASPASPVEAPTDAEPGAEEGGEQPASAEAPTSKLDEILRVTREAAENPRYLDHLTALADRAGDILPILQAQHSIAVQLEEIRRRLAIFADEPEQPEQPEQP
jgi:FHA domain